MWLKKLYSIMSGVGGECANMEKAVLKVRMMGEFSLCLGDVKVHDSASRSRKVWILLAYLICNRDRIVPREELINQLWESEKNDNPDGAVKTTLWRARQILKPFGPSAGHEFIIQKGGGYGWNPEVPTEVDAEQFENLCRGTVAAEASSWETDLRTALALYKGEFLGKFSSESWAEPIAAYYQNLYVNAALEMLALAKKTGYTQESVTLCKDVLRTAPYHEELYQHMMHAYMALDDYKKAAAAYEEMREVLSNNLGILPNEESQRIHQEVLQNLNAQVLSMDMIREQLREKDPPNGALICDYAVFKLFYQAEARSVARRGDAIHIGVLSVIGQDGKELPQRSLDRAMENLRTQVQNSLRRGDVAARCSASQYVVMLLQANYENSCMVCDRITHAFSRAHPHSPAQIHCTVLPLEPLQNSSKDGSQVNQFRSWNI